MKHFGAVYNTLDVMRLFIALLLLGLGGCGSKTEPHMKEIEPYIAPRVISRPIQAYPLASYPGITAFTDLALNVDGKFVYIAITRDSSPTARKLFNSLRWSVLQPNTREKAPRIYLVGQLFEGISRSGQGPNTAVTQDYREFRMDRWFLEQPFDEVIESEADLEFKIVSRRRLKTSDFRGNINVSDADVNELHRGGI